MLTLFILSLLMYGLGYATHKHFNIHQNPEPPQLETPENVLHYLEACSLDQQNYEMHELFSEFRIFINEKQQLSLPGISGVTKKPEWFHNPSVEPTYEEHWDIFLNDLKRETEPAAKLGVVKHWMEDLQNGFTFKEVELILNEFSDSKDREMVRKIYAGKRKERKKKPTQNPGAG